MSDPDPAGNPIGFILVAILFLFCNIILSIGDEAFAAMGDARMRELEEEGDRRAARIRRLTEKPRRFSNRLRAGYLFNGLAAATCVFYCAFRPTNRRFVTWLFPAGATAWQQQITACLALFLLLLAVAFCFLTFGALVPRRLALKRPEVAALRITSLFTVLFTLLWPLDAVCSLVAVPFVRLGGVNPHDDTETVTEEDIRELMDAGEEIGAIEGAQKDMVNNIFEFDDITAAAIMTPRTDVTAVEVDSPILEALQEAVDNGYSRLPVYEEDIDHIIGVLYIKDLLPYVGQHVPQGVTIRHLLRETHFVPDTKKCDELFEEMNEKHRQMAIVVDEYGGVAGIVTMEDLLESIVGNMQDEFDNENEEIIRVDDNTFEIEGSLAIGDLEELLNVEFPEGDYDTVAGFLMDQLGHIPEEDEQATVQYENVTFTILRMDDRRIERVLARITPKESEAENEEDAI